MAKLDTKAVAGLLGTTSRELRRFLRSGQSTFQAVGSGARYEFTEHDIPSLRNRFASWNVRPGERVTIDLCTPLPMDEPNMDEAVWREEGPVKLPDIRNPRVRARVRRIAYEQERQLNVMLYACGLHITQQRRIKTG